MKHLQLCRRSEYDLLLAQFNTYRDSLLLQNATQVKQPLHTHTALFANLMRFLQAEKDAAQKVRRDQQHRDFLSVQASLQAAVTVCPCLEGLLLVLMRGLALMRV